jgi:8-oxo-dGTP pyrophosphatase MutT (NUDIX family)
MSIVFEDPHLALAPVSPSALGQMASLCWRLRKGRVQVLLVTSRETRRWVIPKGWPMEGVTLEAAAAREAWEEAGVTGQISSDPLGRFVYDKVLRDRSVRSCCVTVYPMRVKEMRGRWPERKERRRKWFSPEKAAKKVAEPELRALLHLLADDPLRIPAVAALAQS